MLREDNFAVIIPARFQSSRFPGKPLAKIAGLSLIQRVWHQCCAVASTRNIIIATDDERICDHCQRFGADVMMTSSECLSGTDRVEEVVRERGLDYAINVQGDEPMVRPEDIQTVLSTFLNFGGNFVVNAMAPIVDADEWRSLSVPKVVFDQDDQLLYMSRAPVPANKQMDFNGAWKQVCIYGFSAKHLQSYVMGEGKSLFESHEDIEILRFVECGTPVQMVRVASGTVAVDFPEDVIAVEALLKR